RPRTDVLLHLPFLPDSYGGADHQPLAVRAVGLLSPLPGGSAGSAGSGLSAGLGIWPAAGLPDLDGYCGSVVFSLPLVHGGKGPQPLALVELFVRLGVYRLHTAQGSFLVSYRSPARNPGRMDGLCFTIAGFHPSPLDFKVQNRL